MSMKTLGLGVGLWTVGIAAGLVPAAAVENSHETAVGACAAAGGDAAAQPITAIGDGRGGSLVWLIDADTNLWLCNADTDGSVFVYSLIFDDLLEGAGASLVEPVYVDEEGNPVLPEQDPAAIAELACQAYLDGEIGKVVGRGEDGLNAEWLPGFFVFIETEAGETFLCDATPNGQVWAFAKIGGPLSLSNPVG